MKAWALVLFIYGGATGVSDSNMATTIHGFSSQEACLEAGRSRYGSYKVVKKLQFVCIGVR